jgi:hypothetical protein
MESLHDEKNHRQSEPPPLLLTDSTGGCKDKRILSKQNVIVVNLTN